MTEVKISATKEMRAANRTGISLSTLSVVSIWLRTQCSITATLEFLLTRPPTLFPHQTPGWFLAGWGRAIINAAGEAAIDSVVASGTGWQLRPAVVAAVAACIVGSVGPVLVSCRIREASGQRCVAFQPAEAPVRARHPRATRRAARRRRHSHCPMPAQARSDMPVYQENILALTDTTETTTDTMETIRKRRRGTHH